MGILTGMEIQALHNLSVSTSLLRLVGEIDVFKGRWQAGGNLASDRLLALRRLATDQSVASSTRLDGAKLSESEGYAELMELVAESWREIPLTEDRIKQFHTVLLKYSEKDEHHRGEYKTARNNVEAFDENGRSLGAVFETASPRDTPRLMADLLNWARQELDGGRHHPLLVIGVFVVRFLAVHPFQDGNSRLALALTNLLLLKAGYSYTPYSSLERVVEENKEYYYYALRRAQSTLDKGESQLEEWLHFFLLCLVQQKNSLAEKIEQERLMASLHVLDEQLLQLARQHGRLTLTAAMNLTHANRNTLKLHFRQLVQAGRLRLLGQGRSSWYEPL